MHVARVPRVFAITAAIAVAFAAASVAGACGKSRRPEVGAWEAEWREVRDHLPKREDIAAADDPRAVCSSALAFGRASEPKLFPAPDEVIESTARKWFKVMLGAYMQCDSEGHHGGLDEAFEHAAVIERELDAALRAARN